MDLILIINERSFIMKQSHDVKEMPKIQGAKIAIIQSKWYREYTDNIVHKCSDILIGAGANLETHILPGCLEIPLAAQIIAQKEKLDAIVCTGVLMKGETDHYEMILQSCGLGMQQVSLKQGVALVNAILPVNTIDQVKERSVDDNNNKGIEAAIAAGEFIMWQRAQK
jgi:6,7-dimethyl-8-ribityllumazine synthase